MTKWAVLPVAGGIYDQDPELLDKFLIIHSEINKAKEAEQKRREAEMKSKNKSSGGLGRARRNR